jgi:tetratricopeptide (TPR) repeat protein
VLFTLFEQHKKLGQVLDQLGRVFESALEKNGKHWLTLKDEERRSVALQVLRQVPVLWIWDNVEPVAGFPAGTASLWSRAEQNELADFLRAARATKAKFLLTSRRDERDWLHDLPGRVELPRMPFEERVQMTAALAAKHGRTLEEVEDWRPLLQFTQGNPLTLTVLVGQALRDGLRSKGQIEAFVKKLRAGEAVFEDEAGEGRTRSLAASLAYGFENAFTEAERKQLALLHLFQGFVDVDALRWMGNPGAEWCLPEVKGLTRDVGIALLDRAAEVGLLTAVGRGYYNIHPALPWFFRRLFDQYYAETRIAATRAFVEAMGELGNYYHNQYGAGNRDIVGILTLEEANLLHTLSLARGHAWWGAVTSAMQGLRRLYAHTGRRADWARLVEGIVPYFVDLATEGPLLGREEGWILVTSYRVVLEEEARHWGDAEQLQKVAVQWSRQRSTAILVRPPESWNGSERNTVRTLASSLHELAEIQREQGLVSCVDTYQESLSVAERIHDSQGVATCAFNLGNAFVDMSQIRDLSLAEQWYRRSLDLQAKEDRMGQAHCVGQLGYVAYKRFRAVRSADRSDEECANHLKEAAQHYEQALEMFPVGAVGELAITHHQLGSICHDGGQLDIALDHYREAVRYEERQGNRFGAGQTRYNVAVTLFRDDRFADARDWARAALRDYETCANADQEVIKTAKLVAQIESALQATPPPR